jgi:hypothetical protein
MDGVAQLNSDFLDGQGHRERSFLGGLRTVDGFVLWPFLRLTISSEAVRLAPVGRPNASLLCSGALQLAEILRAERISRVTVFPAPGVRFRLNGERKPLIFWTLFPGRVLDALERNGVTISRHGRPAPFWGT